MFKNAKDSLIEVVIGDAILELLEADAPISHEALIEMLNCHLERETRETRREALLAAIEEVRKSVFLSTSKGKAATHWGGGEGRHSEHRPQPLNGDPPGRSDKKH